MKQHLTPLTKQRKIRRKAHEAGMTVAAYAKEWQDGNSDFNNYDLPDTPLRRERMKKQLVENAWARTFGRKPRNVCRVLPPFGEVMDVSYQIEGAEPFPRHSSSNDSKVVS